MYVWASRNLKEKENMEREHDHAADAALMVLSFDVTIYICVGIVLGR